MSKRQSEKTSPGDDTHSRGESAGNTRPASQEPPEFDRPGAQRAAPFRRALLLGFVSIALLAMATRTLYLKQLQGTLPFSTLIIDGRAYDAWAQQIAAGNWLGDEIFYQAPLYPYSLGALYAAFGRDPMLVRAVQAILSLTACLLLAGTGLRLFGPRTGLIAGLMLAVYPPAVFYDGLIQKAALDLWLMTALLALLAEAAQRRSWPWLLGAGAALGALTLNRENARVLFPILVVWIWIYFGDVPARRRGAWIAAFTAGTALFLLPVGLRNEYVGGEFVLSTSQLGPNFYIGNRAGATGRYEPLIPRRGDPRFERADATRLAEEAAGQKLSPSEVSRYWLKRAIDDIRQQPAAWFRLLGWKFLLVFNATESADSEAIEVYASHSSWLRGSLRVFHFGVILPLAVLGVWLTRDRWRELWLLYAIFGALAASTALFYVFGRYRFLLVPFALLFAAAALAQLPEFVAAIRRRSGLRTWVLGFWLAGVAAVVSNYPLPDLRDDAITYWNLGTGLLLDGRPDEALAPLERAIAIRPDLAGAHHNLGMALTALNRRDEAARQDELALQYAPDYGDAHASLGQYYADHQQPAKAIVHLRRAAALVADPALLHVELGQLLLRQGDSAGAVSEFRAAVHANPDLPIALNSLTWVLATDADPRIRDGAAAVPLAESLLAAVNEIDQSQPAQAAALLDTVAAAYAEAGRFDDALAVVRRAIDLARAADHAELIGILTPRIERYQARQPYHAPPHPPGSVPPAN